MDSFHNSDPVKGQMIAAYTITTITIIIFMAIVCYHIWIAIKTSQTVKNMRGNLRDNRKVFNRKTPLMEVAMLLRLPMLQLLPTST